MIRQKDFTGKNLPKDILAGIIVALVSIPISMGYAEIAGLSPVYGLYGSLLPILFYGLITTSKDFVFGVDAAPAALTGGVLTSMGIAYGSADAFRYVPMITFLVAVWLLFFRLIKAGRVVQYISDPVMGGFITGICLEIILMQVPKLFGGTAGTGEAVELVRHILKMRSSFSWPSFLLGLAALLIILAARKMNPKIPMTVIVMAAGAVLARFADLESCGIKMLSAVEPGLPHLVFPVFRPSDLSDLLFSSLTIAIVITAETLLASKSNATSDGYSLDPNREILAYAVGNLASAFTGSCPVNGSVSRTGIVRQFGAKSQVMSLAASVTMACILCFGTGFIRYLPVPVLTAIVISALLGACEFELGYKLLRCSRPDFYIYLSAMAGVLFFGTIYGVLIGILLSFVAVIHRAVAPPRAFLGVIPGRDGFYSLSRNKNARPINDTVIYRFNGNLFFANIDTFVEDIETSIRYDTKQVIVYGSGIGNIDITAAERLLALNRKLKEKNIRFFLTEQDGRVNDGLRKYGAYELIEQGCVRRTVDTALGACGMEPPYPIEDDYHKDPPESTLLDGINAELEWAFGEDAEDAKKQILHVVTEHLSKIRDIDSPEKLVELEKNNKWGRLSYMDEDEILTRVETYLSKLSPEEAKNINVAHLEEVIEERRKQIEEDVGHAGRRSAERLKERRRQYGKGPEGGEE